MRSSRNGFTFMEILVSITIICILGALLMGAAGSSRSSAKTAVCISNLRQIHAALKLYESDFDAMPPNWLRYKGLQPYFGGARPVCPSAPVVKNSWETDYMLNVSFPRPDQVIQRQCKDTRGGSFPIILDTNHALTQVGIKEGRLYFIVLRDAGNVEKVDYDFIKKFASTADKSIFPCPLDEFLDNL